MLRGLKRLLEVFSGALNGSEEVVRLTGDVWADQQCPHQLAALCGTWISPVQWEGGHS